MSRSMPTANVSQRRNNGATPPTPTRVKRSAAPVTMTLTGNRRNDHFLIEFGGTPIKLTHATLKALVKLIIARGSPGSGFVSLPRVTVYRLRQSLGTQAANLIETGCGEEYRIALDPDRIGDQVTLHSSFFELEEL